MNRRIKSGADVVCLNDYPFRKLSGHGICALPFCGMNTDDYHRQIAIGRMRPEVDKFYDEEAKRILREGR